ncbi:DUF6992 family protein, partial [Sediminibacterium salmoneum]|uniref:DUF6992 family protein n=1 Tax=Sediminibacterium salmoneum TaxID=426421 RepID=UPI0006877F6C
MKQITILSMVIILGLMVPFTGGAQTAENQDPPKDSSMVLNKQRLQQWSDSIATDRYNQNKTNMTILAAWAGVNIIQGSISATNATGSGPHFFRMNAYWNLVNLGIASVGLMQLRKEMNRKYTLTQNHLAQQKLEKILLLNTGLDLAYIATGFLLKENGNRTGNLRNTGFGNSLLLQGAFLLVFDLVQYGN